MLQTEHPTHNLKMPLILAATVIAIAGIIGTVLLTTSSNTGKTHPANTLFTTPDPLAETSKTCTAGTLADNDHTLIVDMAGDDPGTGTATIDDILCVLAELDAPQAILAQMEATRALDGMQSATWSTYNAKWTYHPNDGLDLIITTE
jgi:hypothetical protein